MHTHLMQLIIGYTCVGVFVATAVISVLSLVGVLKIEPKQANRLFQIVIVQIVIICVGVFSGFIKFDPQPVQERLDQAAVDQKELQQSQKVIQATHQDVLAATGGLPMALNSSQSPRVYIQISSDMQLSDAKRAQAALQKDNAIVPSFENVGTRSPTQMELRYFNAADQTTADEYVKALSNVGLSAKPILVNGFDPSKIRPKHFELWFPKIK